MARWKRTLWWVEIVVGWPILLLAIAYLVLERLFPETLEALWNDSLDWLRF
jgi:hypothetical protein